MQLEVAAFLAAFVLGLMCGSFLNVCIARLPLHESVVRPRSHCPRCLHAIRWFDNIPLLSWTLLRARCRDCHARIPLRYPAVELATGLWFVLATHAAAPLTAAAAVDALTLAALGFLLIGLLVMDAQTFTLPDAFTLPGIALGFFLVCARAIFLDPGEDDVKLNPLHSLRMSSPGSFIAKGNVFLTGPEHLVFGRLLAIVVAAALPWLLRAAYRRLRGRDGFGLGDVKLCAMLAAMLGFAPFVLSFFVAAVLALPVALWLLVRRGSGRHTPLPFGAFLCAGGLFAGVFGQQTLHWYLSMF